MNTENQITIQAACRFRGEIAEAIKKMAEEDDRSLAYIVQRLAKERLEQLEAEAAG